MRLSSGQYGGRKVQDGATRELLDDATGKATLVDAVVVEDEVDP